MANKEIQGILSPDVVTHVRDTFNKWRDTHLDKKPETTAEEKTSITQVQKPAETAPTQRERFPKTFVFPDGREIDLTEGQYNFLADLPYQKDEALSTTQLALKFYPDEGMFTAKNRTNSFRHYLNSVTESVDWTIANAVPPEESVIKKEGRFYLKSIKNDRDPYNPSDRTSHAKSSVSQNGTSPRDREKSFHQKREDDAEKEDVSERTESESRSNNNLSIYPSEIRKPRLLTAEEEMSLGKQMTILRSEIHSLSLKDDPRSLEELAQKQEKLKGVEGIVIKKNSGLVISVARRYLGRGRESDDMIQDGNVGLMHAVKKFDYTKGFRFSTYAYWWIRQGITRGIMDGSRLVRLPVHFQGEMNKYDNQIRELEQELGRKPTPDEKTEILGIEFEEYLGKLVQMSKPLSIHTPVRGRDHYRSGDILADMIPDTRIKDPVEEIDDVSTKLLDLLDDPRERTVLTLRLGLDGKEPKTLEEVGRLCGVSRERIRQIEAEALKKLRDNPSVKDIAAHAI